MLFILDVSLLDLMLDGKKSQETKLAIHKVFEAWISGTHLVSADDKLLSEIAKDEFFSPSDRGIAKKIRSQLIQQMNSFVHLEYKILVANTSKLHKISGINGNTQIVINPSFIVNSRITDQSILLVENINDEVIYKKIAQAIQFESKNRLGLSYFPSSGGGGGIFQSYERYQLSKERLCLAIADSDKYYPRAPFGSTAQNLLKIDKDDLEKDNEVVLASVFVYEAREIENTLPTNILYEICNGNKQRENFLQFIRFLESKDSKSRLYVDIKEGFNFRAIVQSGDVEGIEYWKNIVETLSENCHYSNGFDCFANGCVCVEKKGMGPSTQDNSIDILSSITSQKYNEAGKSNKEIYSIWLNIGKIFLAWFCAPKPSYD